MIGRHTEWRNLVNANCDSSSPKSKKVLLQDLKEWERAQGFSRANGAWKLNRNSNVMEKDFDRGAWSQNHGSDFRSLIAQARSKAKKVAEDGHSEPQNLDDTNDLRANIPDHLPSMLKAEQIPEELQPFESNPASPLQRSSLGEANSAAEDVHVVRG